MYSETEIEGAIASGAIDRAAAERLRASIAAQRQSLPADDEMFRLVTGFNDIFVTIAAALLIHAAWTLVGGIAAAAISWGLAEYFTRRKKMALPSIFLLLCFAGGVFSTLAHIAHDLMVPTRHSMFGSYPVNYAPRSMAPFLIALAASAMLTAAAVSAHWKRFHVPITIAALTSAFAFAAGCMLMMMLDVVGLTHRQTMNVLPWIAFCMGVVIFTYAMRWDLADPERVTRRSDVAFWLHLTASPLIVHPLFWQLARVGSGNEGSPILAALGALVLYGLLGVVALIVDRRAVLVSALAYVVVAMAVLTRVNGQIGSTIVISGAMIGTLLLLMSVFWRGLRRQAMSILPDAYRIRLPGARV